MQIAGNSRKFSRTPLQAKVELRLQTGILVEGHSRDLSVRGVWLSTDRSLPVGNLSRVRIMLDTNLGQLRVEMLGRVVRDDEGGLAIEFLDVAEEMEHHLMAVLEECEAESEVEA